ncbi:MAG: hypothetical protein QOK04_2350 [Solirubrobacteraceae bacterium]|nr:hypothetical protein [Solirubrobacteraceae bacterium]
MSQAKELPLACSLPAPDLAERREEIGELLRRSLIGSEREPQHLRLHFDRSPSVADAVNDLVRRERECCPFLDFTVEDGASDLVLSIRAPADATAVLDGFAALGAAAP